MTTTPHTLRKTLITLLFSLVVAGTSLTADLALTNGLSMPIPGACALRILSSDLLELDLINTKAPAPAPVAVWNFVAANGQPLLPSPQNLAATVGGQPVPIAAVGFKRRPLYAPLKQRDLRIGNYLYLQLVTPMTEGQTVEVK